jgi:hypothetical protein
MIRKKLNRSTSAEAQRNAKSAVRREKIAAAIGAIDQLHPSDPKAARAMTLLKQWLSDRSGYDEGTWPDLRRALERERRRARARSLFDG